MECSHCGGPQSGVIMVHNDDETGLTTGITIECSKCHKTLANWGVTDVR